MTEFVGTVAAILTIISSAIAVALWFKRDQNGGKVLGRWFWKLLNRFKRNRPGVIEFPPIKTKKR